MSGQTVLQRGWTFIRNAAAVGASAADAARQLIVAHTTVPFLERRLSDTAQLPDVIRWANLFMKDVREATVGSRALPFGAGGVVLEPYAFTSGVTAAFPHQLNTSRVFAIWTAAGSTTQVNAKVTFDATYVTVVPGASFTAGLVLLVLP